MTITKDDIGRRVKLRGGDTAKIVFFSDGFYPVVVNQEDYPVVVNQEDYPGSYEVTENGCYNGNGQRCELDVVEFIGEKEVVVTRQKLIEAWNGYVTGTERIIYNQPRTFDLHLTLTEAVPVEHLPTSPSPPAAAAPKPPVPIAPAAAAAHPALPASSSTPPPAAVRPSASAPAARPSSPAPVSATRPRG